MHTEEQMLTQVLDQINPISRVKTSKVSASIVNHICAQDVISPLDLPSSNIASMDGFAVRKKEIPANLAIVGEASAGTAFTKDIPANSCIRIATGAWVPDQLDQVVPFEIVKDNEKDADFNEVPRQSNIRLSGSEIARGCITLAKSSRITARNIALLSGLGIDRISTFDVPKIGVLATGNELCMSGEHLGDGACYDANRPMLLALINQAGALGIDIGKASDDADELRQMLNYASSICDAIITIGGASVGKKDLVKQVVDEIGEVKSWQVAIKPGKPFVLGQINNKPMMGLPGNPASSFVTYWLLVLPAIWKLAGLNPQPKLATLNVQLKNSHIKNNDRTEYIRAKLEFNEDVGWLADFVNEQGSASLQVLAQANCLVKVPRGVKKLEKGAMAQALLLDTHTGI